MFLGMSSWGEGRRRSDGNCSLLIQVDGQVGGQFLRRYIPCFEAGGHWPLCIQFNMDQEKELGF